jgi:DNA-binding response OmpR family regulator
MSSPKTILLMDDDADILEAMRLVFALLGHRVVTAGDGMAGIAAAEREKPDAVVVDMMMPKKSGFLVLEKLKSDRATAPRVVMITANEGGHHRAYAEMLGVDDYLRKPFAMAELVACVERLLQDASAPKAPPIAQV